jgi:hypothetical protein
VAGANVLALERRPSRLSPDVDGTNPFSYPRLVQPVLDQYCVACHKKEADKAPSLDSRLVEFRPGWRPTAYYASYLSLAPKFGFYGVYEAEGQQAQLRREIVKPTLE